MARQFFDTEITAIENINPAVKRFFFKVPGTESFHFEPGQFVMLDLPIESKVKTRSYSIASAPKGNEFELCIVINEQGQGTPYLFNQVQVGSVIKCAGPLGKFNLPKEIQHDVLMIATGTGIAPFRAMLQDLSSKSHLSKMPGKVHLIFGNRFKQDILYKEEMEQLAKEYPAFNFHAVLSREQDWEGPKGYVHSIYEDILHDNRPAHIFICGWSAMVREARDRLYARGYTKEHVHFELYD
jgi:NAD(P)H-flavin reductase